MLASDPLNADKDAAVVAVKQQRGEARAIADNHPNFWGGGERGCFRPWCNPPAERWSSRQTPSRQMRRCLLPLGPLRLHLKFAAAEKRLNQDPDCLKASGRWDNYRRKEQVTTRLWLRQNLVVMGVRGNGHKCETEMAQQAGVKIFPTTTSEDVGNMQHLGHAIPAWSQDGCKNMELIEMKPR